MDIEIPGFAIESELGQGAMATVYLAVQRSLDRKVALKVMAASLAADPQFCERFLREGKMLAKLSHPHTVTIHDIGSAGHFYYMAMEYLPGGTLKERIQAGLSVRESLNILRQIADALGYAHEQGVVHRDVKPANILFRKNGSAVLSDFGIAKPLGEGTQLTQAGFAVGTPRYMSPEQAQGKDLDGRSDLYALGIMLYEMLTGKLPFEGTDSLSTALLHLTQPVPTLPPEFARYQGVVECLLAKSPDQRYPDAAAFIAALDAVAADVAPAPDDANGETRVQAPIRIPVEPASGSEAASVTGAPMAPATATRGAAIAAAPVPQTREAGADSRPSTPPVSDAGQAVSIAIPESPPVSRPEAPRPPPPAAGANGRAGGNKGMVIGLVAASVFLALLAGGGYYAWNLMSGTGGDSAQQTTTASTTGVGKTDAGSGAGVSPDGSAVIGDKTSPNGPSGGTTNQADAAKTADGEHDATPAGAVIAETTSANHPLLMPGKHSLFQRVLAKPGAILVSEPGAAGGTPVAPFSVFYVYERRVGRDGAWLRIGAGSEGQSDGWIAEKSLADWKQTLVLKFTERSGRAPSLFLKDESSVEKLLNDPETARRWLNAAESGNPDPAMLAVEPAAGAIPANQFYLLPIFDARESFDSNGQPVQLLKIASIDPGNAGVGVPERSSNAFRTAIVFVVDTSVSMQPYLDRVHEVARQLYQRLQKDNELGDVSFGLVAFRNNTEKTPGLEYVSKLIVDLKEGADAKAFLSAAENVKATTVSSHSFNEDAFAGVMTALDGMDWSSYGGRILLLVSDAGALRKNDPYSRTHMNEAEVREVARGKQVKIFALHLLTEAGKKNHEFAAQQYRILTADTNPQIGDLYIPVNGGSVDEFGKTVGVIGNYFAGLVHDVSNGKPQAIADLKRGTDLERKAAAVGYAMQMDFLGSQAHLKAPELVTAWTADHDLTNPSLPSFQICVLLTKLQLNDLQQALKLIVDAAKRTRSSPQDFFQEIASASARMSRDPSQISDTRFQNLQQSGLLGEYLEGLPYRSKVLSMTESLWLSLSVAEQQDFIDELESKIQLYETFHNDSGNWVRFGSAGEGDALYRVPLSTLP